MRKWKTKLQLCERREFLILLFTNTNLLTYEVMKEQYTIRVSSNGMVCKQNQCETHSLTFIFPIQKKNIFQKAKTSTKTLPLCQQSFHKFLQHSKPSPLFLFLPHKQIKQKHQLLPFIKTTRTYRKTQLSTLKNILLFHYKDKCLFLATLILWSNLSEFLYTCIIKSLMSTVTVGYWNIRGLAQNIRLLLSYTNTPFKEVLYDYDNKTQWFQKDKKDLDFEFPNLPYLIDGDFKLTESSAIARYVIKRSGHSELLGKNTQDEGSVDSIIGVLNDIVKELRGLLLDEHWQDSKKAAFDKIRPKVDYLNKFIGDKSFSLGYLTYADFMIAEFSYFYQAFYPDQRQTYPFWSRIRNNFELLQGIRAYYKRPDAVSEPFGPSFLKVQPKYNRVKFGYWQFRGHGQVTRLLLGYLGVQFQNVYYYQNNQEKWFKDDKVNLGLNFPNVPYLIDGDYNLTESAAINRYAIAKWGRDSGLLGKDQHDSARLDAFMAIFNEVYDTTRFAFFDKDIEAAKTKLKEKFLPKLQQLNAFVGDKDFAFGYLTLADFLIAEGSHYLERFYPDEYKNLPFLQRIRENFNKLPEIVAYYAKPTAFKGKFLPSFALQVEQQ